MIFTVNFLINNSYAVIEDIEPDYGYAPEIDGDIDRSEKEWINATKEKINLIGSNPITDKGIPIEIWVMQNDSDLYISIQFELETHKSQEFIGIFISNSEATSNESFIDAKILQFFNLGEIGERYEYLDYYLLNDEFIMDQEFNGEAAAKLDGHEIVYEFRIPVNNSDDSQDVFLDFGDEYAFKIVYGEIPDYSDGIKKSNIVLIEIEYQEKEEENIWILVHNILCIIIFCGLGGLIALYIYKIIVIKKKIRRVRE